MDRSLIRSFLEALAVGDAFGKATEYCTQNEIRKTLGTVDRLLGPAESLSHRDLREGQVTDDTEQIVYLIEEYCERGAVTPEGSARARLRWIAESESALRCIGPSSLRALRRIEAGEDIQATGLEGTTCGGIMAVPAPFLCSVSHTQLVENVVACLVPTHNTSLAMEAALCYAFALESALAGAGIDGILDAAIEGASAGARFGSRFRTAACGPSCGERIRFLRRAVPSLSDADDLMRLLYHVLGTTMASVDVCAAVLGIFMWSREDVYSAIGLATSTGGDTDTIACLAGGLCCLYRGGHNIPAATVELVASVSGIDFQALSAKASDFRRKRETS